MSVSHFLLFTSFIKSEWRADSETLCEETFIWLFIGNDPKKEQIVFLIRSDKLHHTLLKVYIPAQCIGMC